MINWFTITATKLPNVETVFCKLFCSRPTSGPCYQRMEFSALSDSMFRKSKLIKFNTFSCWLVPLIFSSPSPRTGLAKSDAPKRRDQSLELASVINHYMITEVGAYVLAVVSC